MSERLPTRLQLLVAVGLQVAAARNLQRIVECMTTHCLAHRLLLIS